MKGKTATKNTKIYTRINRRCSVRNCKVETDLNITHTTIYGYTVEIFLCPRHNPE